MPRKIRDFVVKCLPRENCEPRLVFVLKEGLNDVHGSEAEAVQNQKSRVDAFALNLKRGSGVEQTDEDHPAGETSFL